VRASVAVPRAGLNRLRRWSAWHPPHRLFYQSHEAPTVFHYLSRLVRWLGHSEDRTSPCPALLLAGTDETARVRPLLTMHDMPRLPWLMDCSTCSHLPLPIEAAHLHPLGHSRALSMTALGAEPALFSPPTR
jgi:hypothetical protein